MRVVLLAMAVLAGTNVQQAARQESEARQPAVFRVTSDLVQFDALFLDAHGRPLTDVRKDEVTVSQDGRTVALADVRFVRRGSHLPAPSLGAASSAARPDDVESWIFLIDDLAMSPDAFTRVKEGLRAQLQEASVANIQVGVLRTGEIGHRTTQLSNSRDELLRAIHAMRYRPNRWRGGVMSRSGATGAGNGSGDRVFLEGTLGSVNSLLINLRQLTGRKVVVVVSELLALTASDADVEAGPLGGTPSGEYHTVASRLRRLGRVAAEAGVTVHTVNVAGVTHTSSRVRAQADEGLRAVAEELGGLYVGDSNDVSGLLAKLWLSEQGHYVLSYTPPEGTFEDRGTARFVPVTVSVSRPGVQVRTRTGFFTR